MQRISPCFVPSVAKFQENESSEPKRWRLTTGFLQPFKRRYRRGLDGNFIRLVISPIEINTFSLSNEACRMVNSKSLAALSRSPDTVGDDHLIRIAQEFSDGADIEEIASLARILAHSGERLERDAFSPAYDIASTGGPSSLTTLLCPLMLRCRGYYVPKLTVPGRPAGGIDILKTLPGYRSQLRAADMYEILRRSGYAHAVAQGDWAPLDGRLFQVRKTIGLQQVPALVIASILSKKLAVGLRKVMIEIRAASHGNFGKDMFEAKQNADLLQAVGNTLGIDTRYAIIDNSAPHQPFIGRGEALVALADVFSGNAHPWLAEHVQYCGHIVDAALGTANSTPWDVTALATQFVANLEAQGTSYKSFLSRVAALRSAPREIIHAERDATIIWDLARLRNTITKAQRDSEDADDASGVILMVRTGEKVVPGQPIASIRSKEGATEIAGQIKLAAIAQHSDSNWTKPEIILG